MIDTPFLVAAVIGAACAVGHLRHEWLRNSFKHLFVNEISCPKCGARPGVPCFFAGGYACTERFDAASAENTRRDNKRELRANRR